MLNRLSTIMWLAFVILTSIPFFFIALIIKIITFLFDKRLVLLHRFTCFWGALYTWIMPPWRIKIYGKENIRKDATYVVVSNHQSQLDILVSFRLFFHYKWVSKAEMFRVPLIGWNMILNRYVKLRRGIKESIMKMMIDCEDRIREGSSVFIFPEGTRSHDGRVKEFKHGAFTLAKKMKVPVLPIVISGTSKALPKHSINFRGIQRIRLTILKEIPYVAFASLSVEEFAAMVRDIIAKNLDLIDSAAQA